MDPQKNTSFEAQAKPLSLEDQRLVRLYGKVSKGGLLHQQLEGRKYFDSGDYALSQARKPSDAGAVTTGSEHPLRETIPHPLSPVPSSSNVDESANEQGEVSPGLDHAESHAAGARLRGSSITTALERKNSSHLSEEMLPQVGGSHEAGREDVERGRKR